MPTVLLSRASLFKALDREFTDDEFRELCFEYGIELDDVTSEKEMIQRETGVVDNTKSDEVVYKIDVPANRYDLLCLEGLSQQLRVFLAKDPVRGSRVVHKPENERITMFVEPETSQIRQFVVCAVLRGITFNNDSYNSFLDLQDKLHQNICRKRSLVAIGTHDLDSIKAPFFYKALAPQSIEFQPLMEDRVFRADALMNYYENEKVNCKLKPYVKLISSSPVFPVIYDSCDTVLSLPPIINGEHSKISVNTKNVFIECTATDLTKAHIVLNMMVTMFSPYCANPFEVESVNVVYKASGASHVTPNLECRQVRAGIDYINKGIGIKITAEKAAHLMTRMNMQAEVDAATQDVLVSVPPTRPDILHACDIMEDVAVAYGFNNLKPTIPSTPTAGRQQPLNKLSDLMRESLAQAGYTEVLTWALCSTDENYAFLRKADDGMSVKVANPQTVEFQLVRTTLLGGLLKTLAHNQGHLQLPIKLFEVSDVVALDATTDVGARNHRRLAILYCGASSGLEELHGTLDRIMLLNNVRFLHAENSLREKDLARRKEEAKEDVAEYDVRPGNDESFFPGRRTDIFLNNVKIGVMGVVHPEVLGHFGIPNPCAALEIDLHAILDLHMSKSNK